MSNFNALLESKEYNVLVPTIVQESFRDLMSNLNEDDLQKIQEYSDLLKDKKLKRSLEEEISEAIMPILEFNTILYGSFLYETESIEEGCCSDSKNILENLREMLGKEFVAEAADTEAAKKKGMSKTGKTLAGLGAAGLGTAAGLTALGGGDITQGYDTAKDAASAAASKVKDTASDAYSKGKKAVTGLFKDKEKPLSTQSPVGKMHQYDREMGATADNDAGVRTAPESSSLNKLNKLNKLNRPNPV